MKSSLGFTLIEIIMVVVLLGIIAVVTTVGFTRSAEEYLLVKENTVLAQKAQVALNRIFIELMQADNSGSVVLESGKIKFPSSTLGQDVTFSLSGTNLLYNNKILCDAVSQLKFTYAPSSSATSLSDLKTVTVDLVLQTKAGVNKSFAYTMAIKKQ